MFSQFCPFQAVVFRKADAHVSSEDFQEVKTFFCKTSVFRLKCVALGSSCHCLGEVSLPGTLVLTLGCRAGGRTS